MATPVAHYLVGLALTWSVARNKEERARSPWLAAVACVPDLDVLPGLVVGDPSRYHHGVTHSLAAAVTVGAVLTGLVAWSGRRVTARLVLLLAALYASHSLVDMLTHDPSPPRGVPLLWPWRATPYQSPWPLLPNVQHTSAPIVSTHNALLMVREAVVFLPLVGLVHAVRRGRRPWTAASSWVYASWFAVAAGASLASLNTP